MGVSLSGRGQGLSGSGMGFARVRSVSLAEINVTPLVDVMLVLLIIFMISAPLMQQGVHVDLPKANSGTLSKDVFDVFGIPED